MKLQKLLLVQFELKHIYIQEKTSEHVSEITTILSDINVLITKIVCINQYSYPFFKVIDTLD